METHFIINLTVSALVLLVLKVGKGTPRSNSFLCSFALFCWFLPFSFLAHLIPDAFRVEPIIISQTVSTITAEKGSELPSVFDIHYAIFWMLIFLTSIGILIFFKTACDEFMSARALRNKSSFELDIDLSKTHDTPIYVSPDISNGILLGLISPIVVISSDVRHSKLVNLVITHEINHLSNRDNLRLFLLRFAECVFWWNPLVRKLVSKGRFYLEAVCDENSSSQYGLDNYTIDLASLMLSSPSHRTDKFASAAFSSPSANMARIRLLKEKRHMTTRKKVLYAVTVLITLVVVAWNSLAIGSANEAPDKTMAMLGATVSFDIKIVDRTNPSEDSVYQTSMTIWTHFDKKSTYELAEGFSLNFQINDMIEHAAVDVELVETQSGKSQVVANPKLNSVFGQPFYIEIDNPDISAHGYSLKILPMKSERPQ